VIRRELACSDCGCDMPARDAGDPTLIALYAEPVCWGCHEHRCAVEDARPRTQVATPAAAAQTPAERRAIKRAQELRDRAAMNRSALRPAAGELVAVQIPRAPRTPSETRMAAMDVHPIFAAIRESASAETVRPMRKAVGA
jgi:hypothetical protein